MPIGSTTRPSAFYRCHQASNCRRLSPEHPRHAPASSRNHKADCAPASHPHKEPRNPTASPEADLPHPPGFSRKSGLGNRLLNCASDKKLVMKETKNRVEKTKVKLSGCDLFGFPIDILSYKKNRPSVNLFFEIT